MKVQKFIEVRLQKKRIIPVIDVVQYDTGIQFVFSLVDFDIPDGTTAILYVQKRSGKFVYQEENITIDGNEITIDLENQALTEYGETKYQIMLTNGEDTITTFAGILRIEASLADANAVESTTVIRAFDEAVADHVAEFQTKAEQIVAACIATIPDDYTTMEAKVNDLANAVKGNLSGAVVAADDVSPVEHEMNVNVSGVDDPSTITVKRFGKNLFKASQNTVNGVTLSQKNDYFVLNGIATESHNFTVFIGHLPSGTYTLSANNPSNSGVDLSLIDVYSSDPYCIIGVRDTANYGIETGMLVASNYVCRIRIEKGVTYNNFIIKPQLEVGNIATDYEAYSEPTTYIPTADGTVSGLTSVSPNITILTDTEDAIVECEYNRDTNKVIEKLTNAIIALGGTV